MRVPLARLNRFARDESGFITIEAVLWIPFFLIILMLITDTSLAFFSKAQAYRLIENGNRAFAINDDSTELATEGWIKTQFRNQFTRAGSANVTVNTVPDADSGTVSTSLTYRARDVVLFNTLAVLGDWKITVRAQQYVEWSL